MEIETDEIEIQRMLAIEGLIAVKGIFNNEKINDLYGRIWDKAYLDYGIVDAFEPPEISYKEAFEMINDEEKAAACSLGDKLNALKIIAYETAGRLGIKCPPIYGMIPEIRGGKNKGRYKEYYSTNNHGFQIKVGNSFIITTKLDNLIRAAGFVKHELRHVYQDLAINGKLPKTAFQPTPHEILMWNIPGNEVKFGKTDKQQLIGLYAYMFQPEEYDAHTWSLNDMKNQGFKMSEEQLETLAILTNPEKNMTPEQKDAWHHAQFILDLKKAPYHHKDEQEI